MLAEKFYQSDLTYLTTASKSTTQSLFQLPKRTITEKQIIIDILYMLLGMSCSILTKKSSSDQYELTEKYQMTHLSTATLKSAVKQSVKICNQTKYIETQTKKLYSTSMNPIVKTFCEAIFNYLQQTKQKYSQILSEINMINQPDHGKITLLNISKIIESGNDMSGFIIRCLNTCFIEQEMKIQVVRLLDKMWEIEQEMLSFAEFQRKELQEIFKKTLSRYFCIVKDWFSMRKIEDKVGFFILMEDSRKNISEYFLHRSQEIDPLKLPKLLQNQSQGILQIGKTIRFISLFYEDYQQQKLMRYLSIEEEFKVLDEELFVEDTITFKRVKPERLSLNDRIRNKKKAKVADQNNKWQDNPYGIFTKQSKSFNINWVQKRSSNILDGEATQKIKVATQFGFLFNIKCTLLQILENINKKCLSFFRSTYDTLLPTKSNRIQTSLSNTLKGIKKFMLLEQGDFLQQFFNAAQDIIDKQKKQISHNRIYGCIDEAIQNSSAKNIAKQILTNVHFDFIKYPDERSERSKLWVLFCFSYRQDNPINYIFNTGIMDKLKEVCNFIIKLKKGQIVLTKIWDEARENKSRKLQSRVIKKQKVLRNSLNSFLNSIVEYILVKIDILWQEYLDKISTASTVFEIVSQTKQMAQNLQKITLSDKLFFNGTMQSLLLIQKYRKLHLMIKDPSIIIPVREIDQLEFELKSIAEILMKVGGLNEIVNYNGYFDQFQ